MTGIDDQNPLRSQLEHTLNSSAWLQTFKAINQLLHSLKQEIADIHSCDLKWDTGYNGLLIHCPSLVVLQQLQTQQALIVSIANYADCIALVQPDGSEIWIKESQSRTG